VLTGAALSLIAGIFAAFAVEFASVLKSGKGGPALDETGTGLADVDVSCDE